MFFRFLRYFTAALCLAALPAAAHEVRPSIGDLTAGDGAATLDLQLNAEAFIAGIDLDGLEDTDSSDRSDAYDTLRALEPDALAERIREAFPQMRDGITLQAGDATADFRLETVEVGPVGNAELPRDTTLSLAADLPGGAETVVLGWPRGYGTLILRQMGVEDGYTAYLAGGEVSDPIPLAGGAAQTPVQAFVEYIPVGFDHILPLGLDHILFVLGLFLLSTRLGPLLWQVTAFTVAHTVTLALGALGIVTLPGSVVEPIIALSIVYVAVENLFTDGLHRWRPAVIFVFGLLHGLGFASVLGDFGLPPGAFVTALLGFNVGVELGQLTVIAVAFAICLAVIRLSAAGRRSPALAAIYLGIAVIGVPLMAIPVAGLGDELRAAFAPLPVLVAILLGFCAAAAVAGGHEAYRRSVAMPASVLIALVGAYWVVERVFL